MKIVFMFPGQGSQFVGMGKDLFNEELSSYQLLKEVDSILGFSLTDIMFHGDEEKLKDTKNTQPALLTHSIALWNLLLEQKSITHYGVVGHSLGEYSAYVASGRLAFKDAVELVRKRGEFMAASSSNDLGMAAILKLNIQDLQNIITSHTNNDLFIANDNCPGQIVISGLKNTIEKITPIIQEAGGRVMLLPVSGAFHSPYMKEASDKLNKVLSIISFKKSEISLYSNIDAHPLVYGNEVNSLTQQVFQGVLFRESIENMIRNGVNTFIEVGPGRVLQGLVRKINSDVKILGIQTLDDIKNIMTQI